MLKESLEKMLPPASRTSFKVKWHRFVMVGAPIIGVSTIMTSLGREGVGMATMTAVALAIAIVWAFHFKDLPKREK